MAPLENLLPHQMHVLPTPVAYAISQAYRIRLLTSPIALILMGGRFIDGVDPAPIFLRAPKTTNAKDHP